MKNVLTIVLALTIITACNNSKTENVNTTNNEEIVQKYFSYFNKHDWTNMANMYSENADFKDPSFGQETVKQTRQQIIEKYSGLSNMFPDVKDEIIQIYPSGAKHIIVEFVSTGTALDRSMFKLPVCTIFTIENGMITKDFTYYDNFEDPKK